MISAHISLDKAHQMNTGNTYIVNPLMSLGGQRNWKHISTANVENHLVVRGAKHNWKYPEEGRQFRKNFQKNELSYSFFANA